MYGLYLEKLVEFFFGKFMDQTKGVVHYSFCDK